MKKLLLGAVLSGLGLVQAASAADIPVKAPPAVAVVQTWTGYYFGGHAGYAWGRSSVGYTANDTASALLFANFPPFFTAGLNARNRFKTDGGLVGAQFGYNWQIGPRWLVGFETDINLSSINGSDVRSGIVSGAFATNFTAEERVKSFGTLRGRLGVLATPSLLAFVTGGLAYAHVEQKTSFNNLTGAPGFFAGGGGAVGFLCLTAPCFYGSTERWRVGWTAGGGIEHKWSQNLSLKAEYLYVQLQDNNSVTATAFLPGVGGGPLSTYNANFGRTHLNVVRVGANVHFPAGN